VDAPADYIIGSLVAILTFLGLPALLPLAHRFGVRKLERLILSFVILTAAAMAIFLSPNWAPFDEKHPKRILSLQSVLSSFA